MSEPLRPISAAAQARITALAERVLTPEEAAVALAAPESEAERGERRALIRWFVTRYPTPAERLAYLRRANARLTRPPVG